MKILKIPSIIENQEKNETTPAPADKLPHPFCTSRGCLYVIVKPNETETKNASKDVSIDRMSECIIPSVVEIGSVGVVKLPGNITAPISKTTAKKIKAKLAKYPALLIDTRDCSITTT